jgi:serine/threonine-protein kinase HipA
MSRKIALYADWTMSGVPQHFGWLNTYRAGRNETFEVVLDYELSSLEALGAPLDPALHWISGAQHPDKGRKTFGLFQDIAPDRWGRTLMERRFERDKKKGVVGKNARLFESDYLLGVHDMFRVGAIRLRPDDMGDFIDDEAGRAAPPMTILRELEHASRAIEDHDDSPALDEWLRLLLAPGGSLGGARPKASVIDPQGNAWIAKFPSAKDSHDLGAWEHLTHVLAQGAGLEVPDAQSDTYASDRRTFLIRRFDRPAPGVRRHFASAMTLANHVDGEDASTGVSYLEIAEILYQHGAQATQDLQELWRRIVFSLCVSNADDHLRNHGFLLVPGKGWRLSPAYDMNPTPDATGLKLNITENDNALDLELAREVAQYFRYPLRDADKEIGEIKGVVRQWPTIASALGISNKEQQTMAPAFALAAN